MIDPPKSKRHWTFRYSLRTLLVVTSLVAAFLGGHLTPTSSDRDFMRRASDLEIKNREVSKQLAITQVIHEQQGEKLKSALSYIEDLEREIAVRGNAGRTRSYLLEPVPIRPSR